jgi:hypothetical protein
VETEQRVGQGATIFSGARGRPLDVDAALGAGHDDVAAARPVEDDAEVELLGDLDAAGDEHLADGVALDVHAEDRLAAARACSGISAILMPPALPRPPVWTWALTATVRPKERAISPRRRRSSPSCRVRRHAVAGEDLGRLVLVDVHRPSPAPGPAPRRGTRRGILAQPFPRAAAGPRPTDSRPAVASTGLTGPHTWYTWRYGRFLAYAIVGPRRLGCHVSRSAGNVLGSFLFRSGAAAKMLRRRVQAE